MIPACTKFAIESLPITTLDYLVDNWQQHRPLVPYCNHDYYLYLSANDENGAVTLRPVQSGLENPIIDFAPDTRLLEVTITRH